MDPERIGDTIGKRLTGRKRRGAVIWTMRDGTKINIREMGDGHLRNARAMCLRGVETAKRVSLAALRAGGSGAILEESAARAMVDASRALAHFSVWVQRFNSEMLRRGLKFDDVPRAIEASASDLIDGLGGEGRFK